VASNAVLNTLVNPAVIWMGLVWKGGQIALTSAQVMAQRTRRFAGVGSTPLETQREFARMGQEKVQAVLESAQAMSVPLLGLGQQLATITFKQMLSVAQAAVSIAASRTPAESTAHQTRFASDAVTDSVTAASTLSGATAKVLRRGLKPVQKRVNGNARRLRKAR